MRLNTPGTPDYRLTRKSLKIDFDNITVLFRIYS